MEFRLLGLDPAPFTPLYGLDEAALAARGARRMVVDTVPGFPERVEMREADAGEVLLLVNYCHQPAPTPYRASHAVFVREGAETPYDRVGEVPDVIRRRTVSIRAFDEEGMMGAAELCDGEAAGAAFARLLEDPDAAYLHVHYALRGCYAGRVERA
jgi:hypothetical protein